jgi:hypothetical protein
MQSAGDHSGAEDERLKQIQGQLDAVLGTRRTAL